MLKGLPQKPHRWQAAAWRHLIHGNLIFKGSDNLGDSEGSTRILLVEINLQIRLSCHGVLTIYAGAEPAIASVAAATRAEPYPNYKIRPLPAARDRAE